MLAVRPVSEDEITDAMATLIVTNLAMCITTAIQAATDRLTLYEHVAPAEA
jgi:hypothetical protein